MQPLQSQKDIYTAIAQDLQDLSPKLSSNGITTQTDELISDIRAKVQDFSLKMMVYGVYNAGKSTLINALLGQEMAKMGDTPETATITDYKYKDYVIYDTPGLNAKDAHTQETQKCYQTCELVLFVLSNENVDEAAVFDEIAKIKNDKKPIIIAINEKQALDETQWAQIESQVYKNIEKLGFKDAKDSISVYRVNAKSALKAKIDGKNALLDSSRLPELELGIKTLFDKSGAQHIINALNTHISGFINEAKARIDSKIDDKIIATKEAFITRTESAKRAKEIELGSSIDTEIYAMESHLRNASEAEIQSCFDKIVRQIQERVKEIAQELKEDVESVQITLEKYDEKTQDPVESTSKSLQQQIGSTSSDMLDWAQKISAALAILPPHPVLKIPAAVLAIAIPVLRALAAAFNDDDRVEANQQAKTQALAQEDRLGQIKQQMSQSLKSQVKDFLDRLYGSVIAKAREELDSAKGAKDNLIALKKELSSIDAKLPSVNLA